MAVKVPGIHKEQTISLKSSERCRQLEFFFTVLHSHELAEMKRKTNKIIASHIATMHSFFFTWFLLHISIVATNIYTLYTACPKRHPFRQVEIFNTFQVASHP